jgi:hypothetical protein
MRSEYWMLIAGVAIVCGAIVTPLASAQITVKDEYPLCQAQRAAIGEVPDRPFTARVVEGMRRIQPDGKSVPLATTESPAGLVARDSKGRVMVASKITITHEAEGDVRKWSETICDPANGTIATVAYRAIARSSGSNANIPNGRDAYIPNDAEGNAWIRDQRKGHTTAVFAAWHNVVDGRDNLGPETFESLPAYRYRLIRTREEGSLRDCVNSDQLFLQLAETKWKTYPEVEDAIHLTEIHLGEPSPALFDLSSAVHVYKVGHP